MTTVMNDEICRDDKPMQNNSSDDQERNSKSLRNDVTSPIVVDDVREC